MQNKCRTPNKAIFLMSFILMTYSQFSQAIEDDLCPGMFEGARPLPTVNRFEITNPQAPSKPYLANPGNTSSNNDIRTLMALQGETVDLTFTLSEPIRSGCVYSLEISNASAHITNSNYESTTPWKSVLTPNGGYKSEPTTGDNIIKFKLEAAPQFDQDKVNQLYASISRGNGYYLTEPKPFKFKNLAYKITSVTQEPVTDANGAVSSVRIKVILNALPKTVDLNDIQRLQTFYGAIKQMSPLIPSKSAAQPKTTSRLIIPKAKTQPVASTSTSDLDKLNVMVLSGTPMISWQAASKGNVNAHLVFEVDPTIYSTPPERANPNTKLCNATYLRSDREICSASTLIDLPD